MAHYSTHPDARLFIQIKTRLLYLFPTLFSLSVALPCFSFLRFPHSIKPFLFLYLSAFSFCSSCMCLPHPLLPNTDKIFQNRLLVCFPSCKLLSSTVFFSSHLVLVAACHPIIADHPDNVSMSHSSQMIMTLPSCFVTRAILGSYVQVCVCPCMWISNYVWMWLYIYFMCRKDTRGKRNIFPSCVVLCVQKHPCVHWIYQTRDLYGDVCAGAHWYG